MNKDDLLNINGGNNKKDFKKILIYAAVAFLLFVIGVIVFAIYKNMNSSKEESILPPQVKQEPVFKQVPIQTASNNTSAANTAVSSNKNSLKSANTTKKQSENIKQNLLNKPTVKNNTENAQAKPAQIKVSQKPVSISKTEAKTKTSSKTKHILHRNYYIQVAALLKYKKPNKRFLNLIKKYGYEYRFYTTYINKNNKKIKVTKILIGPFTKKEAKENLKKVKKYITQNAFIFKVK